MVKGIDEPDSRGRTNLHLQGYDLTGNTGVRVRNVEILACDWSILRRTTIDFRHRNGDWSTELRETYDRGNGATILLYNRENGTVLLTKQFRYPAYVNGHPDGLLIETPAGLLDEDNPEAAIKREVMEETGHTVGAVEAVFDAYMSPGSVTEIVHFFAAPYSADTQTSAGGGLAEEGEDIHLVELPFVDALAGIGTSILDGKTIMLLQWAALRGPFSEHPAN